MSNYSSYDILQRCQRSFDLDIPVDLNTRTLIKSTIDQFIIDHNLDINSFMITDKNEIKLIHSSAIHEYEPEELIWKTNTQVLAPLLILCMPKKNRDIYALAQIGRLYSKIGLIAADAGYKTGFCLSIRSQVLDAWEHTKKFTQWDEDTKFYVRPIFLSIGKELDQTKPHNWSYVHNKTNPSHRRFLFHNIRVNRST